MYQASKTNYHTEVCGEMVKNHSIPKLTDQIPVCGEEAENHRLLKLITRQQYVEKKKRITGFQN